MKNEMVTLLQLFLTFLKISPITFGGGYATLTLIEKEVVQKHKWFTSSEIINMLAIAQTAPGAVLVNSAIIIGYRVAGIKGLISALLGSILPTSIIVIMIYTSFKVWGDNPIVKSAFHGISATVIAMILYAGYTVAKKVFHNTTSILISVISFFVLLIFNINPIIVILFGITCGTTIGIVITKRNAKDKKESET
ncbi:chromate transporter [Oceanobacillus longus]|uniref:Chromate transporter n=1 Tax=Oceanobacillus longus TaxID=930120 RepID=A0ABV8GUZ5_9BACI